MSLPPPPAPLHLPLSIPSLETERGTKCDLFCGWCETLHTFVIQEVGRGVRLGGCVWKMGDGERGRGGWVGGTHCWQAVPPPGQNWISLDLSSHLSTLQQK